MRLIRRQPAAPLDAIIESFWWSSRKDPQVDAEAMLPSGRCQLILALHSQPMFWRERLDSTKSHSWSRGVLHGPQSRYFLSGPKPPGSVVGVCFRAGAAGIALGVPIADLTDRHVGIEDLWGRRGRSLQEQVAACGNPEAAFRILERYFRSRLDRPPMIHPAIADALRAGIRDRSAHWIAEVREQTGYSHRHFIARFRSATGLAPKQYERMQRFAQALRHLASGANRSLAEVAADAGYADQSHMTREFSEFAGVSPSRYRPRDPGSPFHHRHPGAAAQLPVNIVQDAADRKGESAPS